MPLGKESDGRKWRSWVYLPKVPVTPSIISPTYLRRNDPCARGLFTTPAVSLPQEYLKRMTRAENRPQEGNLPDPGRHPAARD